VKMGYSFSLLILIPRTMRRIMIRRGLLVVAVLLGTLLSVPYAAAQPSLCVFQGAVTARNGYNIPDDIVVSAWIDGIKMAETQVKSSWYEALSIAGDYTGKTVTFKVGKFEAQETAMWKRAEVVGVDLSIASWPFECYFYGSVLVHANVVPDGTEVSAWIDSAKVHSTTTTDSRY